MDAATKAEILQQYQADLPRLRGYAEVVEKVLKETLNRRYIKVFMISARIKERDSLSKKLDRKKYDRLHHVTDLIGVRVVVYLPELVDQVADIVEELFKGGIDDENSVDYRRRNVLDRFSRFKRIDEQQRKDHEQFRYVSLHYVVWLAVVDWLNSQQTRETDVPYRVEIQIRTLLEHGWAEIEHSLVYKPTGSEQLVPYTCRRRLSALAGMLELVDSEFSQIKREIEKHATIVMSEISSDASSVKISEETLHAFVTSDPTVQALDEEIRQYRGWDRLDTDLGIIRYYVQMLHGLKVHNYQQLQHHLNEQRQYIVPFMKRLYSPGAPCRGISVYYLALCVVAAGSTGVSSQAYFEDYGGSPFPPFSEDPIPRFLESYRSLRAENPLASGMVCPPI